MKIDINKIPNNPWIYIFKNNKNQILYIWKAKDLRKRISQYFSVWSVWKQDMLKKAENLEFMMVDNEEESLLLESNMIKQYRPPYNSLLKWDNSYTYIKITNETYPQVIFTRYKSNDWGYYIWPKTNKKNLIKLLQFLASVLQFRQCKNTEFKRWKLCSRYDFWLCKWWCQCHWSINQQTNKSQLDCSIAAVQYQRIMSMLISFFRWDVSVIQDEIKSQINDLIIKNNFEWAAKLRDLYFNIEKLTWKQSIEIDRFVDWVWLLIKQIGTFYVFVIMNFYKWKIVDIIRYKYSIEDISLDNLKTTILDEYGKVDFTFNNWTIFGYSKDIWKLPKNYKIDINLMLEKSLESYIVSTSFESDNLVSELLSLMKTKYNFRNYPYRLECLDISHLWWSWSSWWLSVMIGGIMYNKLYRKYKIQMKDKIYKNDDYLAIKEVLIRRFELNKNNPLDYNNLPDIVVLDWWKGHLSIIKELYEQYDKFRQLYWKVEFVSLWKWKARKRIWKNSWIMESLYFFDKEFEMYNKDLDYDNVDKLLIKLRDEAHRFSNYYRKQQMKSEFKL